MELEKYEEFISKGNFTQISNYLMTSYCALGLESEEYVFLTYIMKWITKPKRPIYDYEISRDLGWSRNMLLKQRRTLKEKKYLTSNYSNEYDPEKGYRSTGYYYCMQGLFEKIYSYSSMPEEQYLRIRLEAEATAEKLRLEKAKHLNFKKRKDKSIETTTLSGGSPSPTLELDITYIGDEEHLGRAPINTDINTNEDIINTEEVVSLEQQDQLDQEKEVMNQEEIVATGGVCCENLPDDFDEDEAFLDNGGDEDWEKLAAEEDEEFRRLEYEKEHPSNIEQGIIDWFVRMKLPAPKHYIEAFKKKKFDTKSLQRFWLLKIRWMEYPEVDGTDRSLYMLSRNLEGFIQKYWDIYEYEQKQENEMQERIQKRQELEAFLDAHSIWWKKMDMSYEERQELRSVCKQIDDLTQGDKLHDLYWSWSCNTKGFCLTDGKLFRGSVEVNPSDFTKEAIYIHIEKLKQLKMERSGQVLVTEDEFTQSLMNSLKDDEAITRIPPWMEEQYIADMLKSLEEE